jgi:hypothetical protein
MAGSADGLHYRILGSDTALLATDGNTYVKLSTTPQETHLYTSPDLSHWTPRDTVTGLFGLIYDSTRFWAVGAETYTSTDGISWTDKGPSQQPFAGIAYGGGRYIAWSRVALQSMDSLWYSTDGSNWAHSSTPIHIGRPTDLPYVINYGQVIRVRFFNGQIFVVTTSGLIMHSTDGVDYSIDYGGNGLGQFLTDVQYNADSAKYYFFSRFDDGTGRYRPVTTVLDNPFVSTSGQYSEIDSISGLSPGMLQSTLFMNAVVYSRGHFVSVVNDREFPPYHTAYLIWSTDGVHWDSHKLDREMEITSAIATGDRFRIEGTHNQEVLADFSGTGNPLPVVWLDFNAKADRNTTVLLDWKTGSEQNSRLFAIQRSTGAGSWDNIGIVSAAGNSSSTRSYTFTDDKPSPGINSYRLQLVNVDNSAQLSDVKLVYLGPPASITLYPNPAKDYLVIRTTVPGENILILYDAAGREILRQTFSGFNGVLYLGNRAPGVYYVGIRLPDGTRYRYPIVHLK